MARRNAGSSFLGDRAGATAGRRARGRAARSASVPAHHPPAAGRRVEVRDRLNRLLERVEAPEAPAHPTTNRSVTPSSSGGASGSGESSKRSRSTPVGVSSSRSSGRPGGAPARRPRGCRRRRRRPSGATGSSCASSNAPSRGANTPLLGLPHDRGRHEQHRGHLEVARQTQPGGLEQLVALPDEDHVGVRPGTAGVDGEAEPATPLSQVLHRGLQSYPARRGDGGAVRAAQGGVGASAPRLGRRITPTGVTTQERPSTSAAPRPSRRCSGATRPVLLLGGRSRHHEDRSSHRQGG